MKSNLVFNKEVKNLCGNLTSQNYLEKLNFTLNGRLLFNNENLIPLLKQGIYSDQIIDVSLPLN